MIKAVVFDFDGTLTQKNENLWKRIWKRLGYDTESDSYYDKLYKDFMAEKITHSDWCDLTCKAYQEKGFNEAILDELVDDIHLMNGAKEILESLYAQGVSLHIVSGSIVDVIEKVLGDCTRFIDCIKANDFVFDANGNLTQIVGTKHDFIGKANYIKELCELNGYEPSETCFVGNGGNDEFVHLSGCRTICINPDNTDSNNSTIWHKKLEIDNLLELEKKILGEENEKCLFNGRNK